MYDDYVFSTTSKIDQWMSLKMIVRRKQKIVKKKCAEKGIKWFVKKYNHTMPSLINDLVKIVAEYAYEPKWFGEMNGKKRHIEALKIYEDIMKNFGIYYSSILPKEICEVQKE